jgi:hypothetical protein
MPPIKRSLKMSNGHNKPERRTKNTFLILVVGVVNEENPETGEQRIIEKLQPVFKSGGKPKRFVQDLRMQGLWVAPDVWVPPHRILQVQVNPPGIDDVYQEEETGETVVEVSTQVGPTGEVITPQEEIPAEHAEAIASFEALYGPKQEEGETEEEWRERMESINHGPALAELAKARE